ncbi:cysteine proteinase [Daldinia sp. FL1419]|nr:cysteine proteinase [Daldinia sp. FL1419]
MRSYPSDVQSNRLGIDYPYKPSNNLIDRLQQPSIIVPLLLFLFTLFYQYLHTSPFSRPRHPGELLWDLVVAIAPATVLYALEDWLHPPTFPIPGPYPSARPRSHATKSELLRKILGMDGPGSIISSVADAGRRSLSSLSSSSLVKNKTDRPPGLGNFDNSCFQNSVLQGLSSLESIPPYLARGLERNDTGDDRELGSTSALRDLISKLTSEDYNGKTLWTPKKLKSLDTWQQQDAQEYFSKILDEVEKEICKAVKSVPQSPGFEAANIRDDTEDSQHSDDSGYQSLPSLSKTGSDSSLLRNPLEGLVAQRVACVRCGHSDGLSMTPFNCLTLNLGLEQTEHDLYERLDSYTDLETIEGVECAKCTLQHYRKLLEALQSRKDSLTETELEKLNSRLEMVELALEEDDFREITLRDKCEVRKWINSTKTRQVAIARPPQSLAIHMNRSVFDENTGQMSKNLAVVRFPKSLDLGPWCLGSASESNSLPKEEIRSMASSPNDSEQWVTDPRLSMVSGDLGTSRISGPLYELRAVITHQGRHENGHYVCYRKHPCEPLNLGGEADSGLRSNNIASGESTPIDSDDGKRIISNTDVKWWRLSDETVWEVSEEIVLAQGGVFMLFYDRVDPIPILVPQVQHEMAQTESDSGPFVPPEEQNIGNTREIFEPSENVPLGNNTSSDWNEGGPKVETNGTPLQEISSPGSILIPPLKNDERVDPTIPLCWSNS